MTTENSPSDLHELHIEVTSEAVTERRITTARGDFTAREQPAWGRWPGDAYPSKITLQLAAGQSAHRVGTYRLAPTSLAIDRYGKLEVKRYLDLLPVEG